jgi:protein O-mannosyl-transferase
VVESSGEFTEGGRPLRAALVLLALVVATLLAYQPAWSGGVLWDDAGHLTRGDLQPVSGLWKIWFRPGATQQYYPVVHSVFWVLHRLVGDHTTGYHLLNILLHAGSAFLLWRLLQRLAIPGALVAAVVLALHPLHVE